MQFFVTFYFALLSFYKLKIMFFHYSTNKILSLTIVFLSIFIIESCKDDDSNIPYADVNIYINVNSTQYIGLNSVGGSVYLTGGFRGIIVYRLSPEEFVAFERTCPYDPEISTARVEVESSGLTVIDSTCGSRFILIDGSVYSGPATKSLKSYRTNFNGEVLHIFN